jgi:transposase-like protein
MVKDFRELRVYQTAFDYAFRIFELSRSWPPEERYSLTDQVRRSSRSVVQILQRHGENVVIPRHL